MAGEQISDSDFERHWAGESQTLSGIRRVLELAKHQRAAFDLADFLDSQLAQSIENGDNKLIAPKDALFSVGIICLAARMEGDYLGDDAGGRGAILANQRDREQDEDNFVFMADRIEVSDRVISGVIAINTQNKSFISLDPTYDMVRIIPKPQDP